MPVEDVAGGCLGTLVEFFIYDFIAAPGRLMRYLLLKLSLRKVEWSNLSGHQKGKSGEKNARWNVVVGLITWIAFIVTAIYLTEL